MHLSVEMKSTSPERKQRRVGSSHPLWCIYSSKKLRRNKRVCPAIALFAFCALMYWYVSPRHVPHSVGNYLKAQVRQLEREEILDFSGLSLEESKTFVDNLGIRTTKHGLPAGGGSYTETERISKDKNTSSCNLPNLIPFHPTIMDIVAPPPPVNCTSKEFPLLFDIRGGSQIVRLQNPQDYGFYHCCFTDISRKPNDDEDVHLSEDCTPIVDTLTNIPVTHENILISCIYSKANNTWKDIDVFGLPRPKSEASPTKRRLKNTFNIVILGLDAVSNMNFQRTMRASHQYLTQNLSAFGFDGYTKVGDNTFPNAVAALTGKTVTELSESCWKGNYFDDCPFLWNNFSSRGYRTSFGEDAPFISAFNYYKKGFRVPPADYYLRPLFLAQDLYIGHEDLLNANVCYGPRLAFQVVLRYMKDLAITMATSSEPYFQWMWATTLFHDDVNAPALGDEDLLETLKWFNDGGYLNNSILVLMSDHGMRWGAIRQTLQGKIEERMPLLYFVIPPWFRKKYPKAVRNLASNGKSLTTPFDVYETLLDLASPLERLSTKLIFEREKSLSSRSELNRPPRGISLFLHIPKTRNCKTAQIDDHWCTCVSMNSIDKESQLVKDGGVEVVAYINSLLLSYTKCAELRLEAITQSQELFAQGNLDYDFYETMLKQNDGTIIDHTTRPPPKARRQFEISVRTSPGSGIFEATAFRSEDGEWEVDGAISRTNLYGNQSWCMPKSELKLFCFCI